MDNRSSTPQRHETFDQGGDRDFDVATPTLSEPATFDVRHYRRDNRIAHPQETGMLDAVAFAVAIVITLGPLLAYSLGYGA